MRLPLPLALALPDPGRMNLVLRYTDGIAPLSAAGFGMLLLYGLLWTLLLLAAASVLFRGRRL